MKINDTLFSPHFIARRTLYKKINKIAKNVIDGKLIDIGCGEQPYRNLFRVNEYIGIEINYGGHEKGKKKADLFYNGRQLPFDNDEIDWILCSEVLEHISEPKLFLSECYRVLKPGGGIILTTPQTWGLHEEPYDFFRYTKYGLEYLFLQNGFKIISIESTTGSWATYGQRLAAFMFYTWGKRSKIRKAIISAFFCLPTQVFAIILDHLHNHTGETIDNIVFAKKDKRGRI